MRVSKVMWSSVNQPKPHYPQAVTRATAQVAVAVANGQSKEFAVSQLSVQQKSALNKFKLL